jgi:hypothetical protein
MPISQLFLLSSIETNIVAFASVAKIGVGWF